MLSSYRLSSIAARMTNLYGTTDPSLVKRVGVDADHLRSSLVATLAKKHQNNVGDISDAEYRSARDFLASVEHFFTFDYDLLLSWALVQETESTLSTGPGTPVR